MQSTENGSVTLTSKCHVKENLIFIKQSSEEHLQSKLDQKNREISKLKSKIFQIQDAVQNYDNFVKKILSQLDPNIKREMTGEYEDVSKKLFSVSEGKVNEEECHTNRSPSKTPTRSRPSLRTPVRTRMPFLDESEKETENKEELKTQFMELYDENIRLKEELNDKMDEIDFLSAQLQENKQPQQPIPRSLSNNSTFFTMGTKISPKTTTQQKKHQLLEYFTDQEVSTVFENEMISRLVTCRDLALSPSGIHPDVLTLVSFLKAGSYVTGMCYAFLGRVVKSLYNMFKTSSHMEKLIFWLVQVVYLADWVAADFKLGPVIATHGLDFKDHSGGLSPRMSPTRSETAQRFLSDLREIALKIYGKIVRTTIEALRPVLQKLVRGGGSGSLTPLTDSGSSASSGFRDSGSSSTDSISKSVSSSSPKWGGGGGLRRTSNGIGFPEEYPSDRCMHMVLGTGSRPEDPACVIIATLNKHYILFEKALLCSTLVLQYFNQIYGNMDAIMFNELFRIFPNVSGEIGVSIKLGISQLNWWKYENLRKFFPSKENSKPNMDSHLLPLCEIGVFDHLSQAINVLVLDKGLFEDENFVEQHFHNLSPNHLNILLGRFVPDAMSPHEVPSELLRKLKEKCQGQELVPLDEAQNHSILSRKKTCDPK